MEENVKDPRTPKRHVAGLAAAAVALVAVLVAAFVGYGALAHSATVHEPVAEAEPGAETVMLADYDSTVYTDYGAPLRLSEIADGKPLVVNFWATWCPYCIQEMDDYRRIYEEYGERVSFAFVDCVDGRRETVADGATWLAENGYDLPAYYDTDRDAVNDFGASSLPTTVIVNAEGEILTISPGVIDPDLMRDALDSLLAGE